MPFTPAHAVVALPFLRTPLVPAAIAIGAMTPDAPLFFRVGLSYWTTHDWVGLVLVDLPLGALFFVVWRALLRPAAADLAPRPLRERLPREWAATGPMRSVLPSGPRGIPALVLSLLLGGATHIVWDAFTHSERWGSDMLPILAERWGPLEGTAWAQQASSVVGFVVLAWFGWRWLAARSPRPVEASRTRPVRALYWTLIPVCLAVAAVAVAVTRGVDGATEFAMRAGTAGGAAILVVTALAAGGVLVSKARHARDAP